MLGVEKLLHKAEVTMQLSGKTLHADATAPDMYAAIDVLVDKVETQLRKHKEKRIDNHRPGRRPEAEMELGSQELESPGET